MTRAPRIVLGVVVAGGLVAALILFPVNAWMLHLVDWLRGAGWRGALLYALAYIIATLLLLPGSMLTLGAGFAYGPILGTLLVSPASVLGATLAFLLGRSMAREWVAKRMAKYPRFAALDQAIGASGLKIVFLLRLSPLFPFNLLNYGLGLTKVRLRDYVVASFLGMFPGTFLYVYIGSLVTSTSELVSGRRPGVGPWGQALYFVGAAATVLVTVLLARVARGSLDRALQGKAKP